MEGTISRTSGNLRIYAAVVLFCVPLICSQSAWALGLFTINIVPGTALAANSNALAAFDRAAAEWETKISDPITITINANLSTFSNNRIIGSTAALNLQSDYGTITGAMSADASDSVDAINHSLPTATQFANSVHLPTGVSLAMDDNSQPLVGLTKANAKALGFSGLDSAFGASDGTITFNSAFNFSYANTTNVPAGSVDFQSVAAHEIGHVLGFDSGVDDLDEGSTVMEPTTLDLFRFANGSDPTTTSAFTTTGRSYIPGEAENTDDVLHKLAMSTGANMGDGNQASHWKADEISGVFEGVMDPTLADGTFEMVGNNDFEAMDLIGYDISPEPATIGLVALPTLIMLGRWRRNTRRKLPDYPPGHPSR